MKNFNQYLRQSDKSMLSLFMCMDNAHAAEKMYDWGNVGDDNLAWQEGPFISAGANCVEIDRTRPYCLRGSDVSGHLVDYQFYLNPSAPKGNVVPIGHDDQILKATTIIPTTSICMQFAMLETFEFATFARFSKLRGLDEHDKRIKRYERRPVESRMTTLGAILGKAISKKLTNAYLSVAGMRNVLTHESGVFCNSPLVAMDAYLVCQAIAYHLHDQLTPDAIETSCACRVPIWIHKIDEFDVVKRFR